MVIADVSFDGTTRRLALIRHPPPAVAPGVCYGRLDLDLTPDAPAQMAAIIAGLAGFVVGRVFTSPARRCRRVAEAIGADFAAPVRADSRLLEMDFGDWEGRSWEELPRADLDAWAADPEGFAPPGGESAASVVARVSAFASTLEPGCVIVSHGGPLKILSALLGGRRVDVLAPTPALGSVEMVTLGPGA